MICLHGPRQRVGLVLRHDLVPCGRGGRGLVELLAWHVRRDGASAVIVAVYTEAPDVGRALPHRAFVDALCAALPACCGGAARARWPVVLLHAVAAHAARRKAHRSRLWRKVPQAQFAAEATFSGQAVLADRAELEASIRPPRNAIADAARMQALDVATTEFARGYADDGAARMRAAIARAAGRHRPAVGRRFA